VRDSLRRTLAEEKAASDPEVQIAAVLRFARFAQPIGDIDQILEEVERGRELARSTSIRTLRRPASVDRRPSVSKQSSFVGMLPCTGTPIEEVRHG
jgi:hypothetical protein